MGTICSMQKRCENACKILSENKVCEPSHRGTDTIEINVIVAECDVESIRLT
jgi:hypothetical protein